MTTPTTIKDAIDQAARENLASVTVGNQSASTHSISDLIEADRYLASKNATANGGVKGFGLRFQKIKPPGGG